MRIRRRTLSGVPVLQLVGDLGCGAAPDLVSTLDRALGETQGPVILDFTATEHLHIRLAELVTAAARSGRLVLAGPSPYVSQILRLAGVMDDEVRLYGGTGEAVAEAAA